MKSRREFIRLTGLTTAALMVPWKGTFRQAKAQSIPATADPLSVPKYVTPLLIPPVMPKAGMIVQRKGMNIDYYEISVRQFAQQILPAGLPATTVWGYGAVAADSERGLLIHNAPSLTIEASWNRPVPRQWMNELVDAKGKYLPHLLAVDPTLHWANPPGGTTDRDTRPTFTSTPGPYTGPVPLVTHVHGACVPAMRATATPRHGICPRRTTSRRGMQPKGHGMTSSPARRQRPYRRDLGTRIRHLSIPQPEPGLNDLVSRPRTGHDAAERLRWSRWVLPRSPGGPAGDGAIRDSRTGTVAVLPGPAPKENDSPPNKRSCEIPIAIQDRAFNTDGSLFTIRTHASSLMARRRKLRASYRRPTSPPIWNPEFFGNMIMVNGNTWPFQVVEKRRYRIRVLNGCQSRFLILDFSQIPGMEVRQIGNEGGFLTAPVNLTATNGNHLLMALAERADLILDFTNVPIGNYVLRNVGPDEPLAVASPMRISTQRILSPRGRSCNFAWCPQWRGTRRPHRSSWCCPPLLRCPLR